MPQRKIISLSANDLGDVMQGACNGAQAPDTQHPRPTPETCVLDIHEDFLELSNASSAVALRHLYVRLKPRQSRTSSTLFLQKVPKLFMTDMVLEGDGQAVRGVEAAESSRLYMESAFF